MPHRVTAGIFYEIIDLVQKLLEVNHQIPTCLSSVLGDQGKQQWLQWSDLLLPWKHHSYPWSPDVMTWFSERNTQLTASGLSDSSVPPVPKLRLSSSFSSRCDFGVLLLYIFSTKKQYIFYALSSHFWKNEKLNNLKV